VSADFAVDHEIATRSNLLGERAVGLAGCVIGFVDRKRLGTLLDTPEHL